MRRVQKDIYELLEASSDGLTINQVADIMNIDRHTAAKELEGLAGLGVADFITKGKSKIWNSVDSPLLNVIKQDSPVSDELKWILGQMDEHVTIQDDDHNILYSNKENVKGRKCHEVFANKDHVCQNCEVTNDPHQQVKCQDYHMNTKTITNPQGEVVGRVNIRKVASENQNE